MKAFRGECYILPKSVDEVIRIIHLINTLGYGGHSNHTLYYATSWWKPHFTLRYNCDDGIRIHLSGYSCPDNQKTITTEAFIERFKTSSLKNKLKEYLNESI